MKIIGMVGLFTSLALTGCAAEDLTKKELKKANPPTSTDSPVSAAADPQLTGEKFKLPDVNAKEWKELKDNGGLKIWDVTEGKGDEVKPGGTVTAHYTGWLTDGTIFDSSHKGGKPISFPLTGVVKGWQEGIPGMKVGGVRRLYIPYAMAYGERGRDGIPPKADLIFEVELTEKK